MDPERAKYLSIIASSLRLNIKMRRYFETPTPDVVN